MILFERVMVEKCGCCAYLCELQFVKYVDVECVHADHLAIYNRTTHTYSFGPRKRNVCVCLYYLLLQSHVWI